MRILVLLLCFLWGKVLGQETGVDLTIKVSNIKEKKGLIRIGVFKTEDDYKKKINQVFKGSYPAVENSLIVTYQHVPVGSYAIILFHDINENDRNDSNAIGIPQEPFGLSNNIKPGVGLPAFSKTKFEVADKNISVDVELQTYKKKWSVGVGGIATVSPFVDCKPRYLPLPIIAFQGDKLDVLGTQVHYTLWRNEKMHFALGVRLNLDGYNSDDSYIFQDMPNRKFTLEGGMKCHYHFNNKWSIKTDGYYDLLNISNGLHGSVEIARNFGPDKWRFTSSLGVKWEDENYVDYYYGVKGSEENSNRFEYHPSFSISPYAELKLLKFWGDNWASFFTASAAYLDTEIQDSPLVDKKVSFSFLAAFVYRF